MLTRRAGVGAAWLVWRRLVSPGGFAVSQDRFYIPGELGIRHEDTVAITVDGCENLAPKWSGTPEEPAVV